MTRVLSAALCLFVLSGSVLAQPPASQPRPAQPVDTTVKPAEPDVKQMTAKAIAYLRQNQDAATGGWSINPKGPSFPAITGLVVSGMLAEPGITDADPNVAAGVKYMLDKVQPDGGIYDQVLPSYNTSICLSALSKVKSPAQVMTVIKNAQDFLRTIQYGEGAVVRSVPDTATQVPKSHAFYGGVGYGRSGRPDLSNTAFVLQALHDSGVPSDDPAFQRALVFLQRTQMIETKDGMKINEMEYAKGSKQGGFIYSTSVDKDNVGVGQSQTAGGPVEETLDDGTRISRLRAYGSMTYAGFKSYMYAGLKKDDPRVLAAMDWISRNYSLTENPGTGQDGMYYYYVVFARAMQANDNPLLRTIAKDGSTQERRWAKELVARLATLQEPDGSFRPMKDGARWMEDNKVLITAYALIALEAARADLEQHPIQ